jgi:general secretion pathway protein G
VSSAPDRFTRLPERGGFTIIELLVVLTIVAALAGLVAPELFRNAADAKVQAARTQIEMLALALDAYRLDNDAFPSGDQGLEALRILPLAGDPPRNWRGPYLRRLVPKDPWGRPYQYLSPGRVNTGTYDLFSLGRDGNIGGEGEDADLTSWGGPVQ